VTFHPDQWALILGGSSGLGLAAAHALSRRGMSVCVVHRDRQGAMGRVRAEFDTLAARGVGVRAFNVDALAEAGRRAVIAGLAEAMGPEGRVRLLLHSIALGNLRPALSSDAPGGAHPLDDEDYARTVHAMGTSLATWTQALLSPRLFAQDARVLAFTSEGNRAAWPGYAAVAAAKGALEACARALAIEGAPHGLRANVVQAGACDTPALRLIPGHAHLLAEAARRNPFGRLTTPDDVAGVVALLCTDEARWINGTVVVADGGEHLG